MSVLDWFKGDAPESNLAAPAVDSVERLALYEKDWCPYCERVKSVTQELGLNIQHCDINEPEHLQALMHGGGQRMVPCLRIESEPGQFFWLYESADIIAYLRLHAAVLK
ncbi:glutaredoxin family protein [Oceanisphaera sp. IT1-181]|uniref:glutaredoxin family protein n=1 Tax=Oceanisphaera sp. IT1-181 TaxID=3081199 RepID=UPI0029CA5CE9|nr:glutathione S-transferase N-terminal domain-containing protein [Oceanisphaera sp. IT1-181]